METEILNLINNSSNILIITHVNPDGDTLGSACALKSFIGDKSDILIQINDNFNFPSSYSFLPEINKSINLSDIKDRKYDLIIAVDVASKDRIINEAAKLFDSIENTIVIDHHKTNKGFAKLDYVKGGISSTGEVLYDLFEKLNIKITSDIATCLYTAILTDTGCFKYESTTEHTFEIAKKLSQTGISTSGIADLCYTNKPKNLILFQNYIITNAHFCLNDKVACALVTKDAIEKYNAKDEYTEGIAETLRSIAGVELAFVLKETPNGTKVSIRSKETDATKITDKFGGGGHKRAAGCTIKLKINAAQEALIAAAKELLQI